MRRLGLDIGTNSIGWCLTEGPGDEADRIVDIGVRIFSDGREPPKSGSVGRPLGEVRRLARGMRRRRDRYLRRRSAFLEGLIAYGLMPADADEAKMIADGKLEQWRDANGKFPAALPYMLRAKALDAALTPYEIGRALFHLNQRRGFKSNRKAERKVKDGEDGKIATAAKALDVEMQAVGARTLGEFLAGREQKRVRMGGDDQAYDFYPQRSHVLDEFRAIWAAQRLHHPRLLTADAFDAIYRIIEFQRPLKPQEVGLCLFAGSPGVPADERRLPKAHPLFQLRRLYEEVNQLEVTTPGEASRKLTLDERDRLVQRLGREKSVLFERLAKEIKLEPGQSFNKASETRKDLPGNEVRKALGDNKRFGDAWEHLDGDRQWAIIDRLMEEENPDALMAFLKDECGLDDAHAVATAKVDLPEGHGRLGLTATTRILHELRTGSADGRPLTYAEAVERCGWHHSNHRTSKILPQLPYYGELLTRDIPPGTQDPNDPPEKRWGRITNPTVHIGLGQLQKLVNAIIAVHGRPDQIVVELARELKLNEKDKEEENRRIRKDTADAKRRGQTLSGEDGEGNHIGEPIAPDTGANRALLKLWEELNPGNPLDRRCPYCGEQIGIRTLFDSAGGADIDHIIPYSKSLDDSASNKVVAHRKCNQIKGNETPYDRWGHDEDRWEIISAQVARMHKSKQWRFGPDAMERVKKDGGFLARQMNDTQHLSRLAGRYLGSLYPTKDDGGVYVIPGRMTAMLRRLWGLNSLLPDHNIVDNKHSNAPKNRLDHRHHAIDAAVVAVTTRSLLQRIARTAGLAEDKNLDRLFEGLDKPWERFRDDLRDRLLATIVSHKADHGRKGKPAPGKDVTAGKLHNDTAYGLTGETSAKGLPIVVHRVPLGSLKPADMTDPERIPDPVLRDALHRATDGLTGKPYDAALARFAKENPQFAGIRRVRVREPLSVIPIRDGAGRAYKAYAGSSNDRYIVWRLPDGSWKHDVVSTFEAHQRDHLDERPHPAAKKILCLRQNDLIAVERNGGPREIMRVIKFTTNGQMALVAHNEAGKLGERHKDADDPLTIVNPTAGGLRKIKARQVRIDPLGRIFDPGPR